jgi:exonuclease III/SAM-dependent methyltransferase
VRLASINLNKRLGNSAARAKLTTWLRRHNIDVLVAQEPWKPIDRQPIDLAGFRVVDGDGDLFCWVAQRWTTPPTCRPETFVQRVELAWLAVFNTYLDAYSATERGRQLQRLSDLVSTENGRPSLLCGDFNLAPRPVDGITDGQASTFNTTADRNPFVRLLSDTWLVDTTADQDPQFTVEREIRGRQIRFRCDLALVSDHLRAGVEVSYDHTTRTGAEAFTDHSAMLIDARVDLEPAAAEDQDTLFTLLPAPFAQTATADYQPHKTAMTRRGPSPFARTVVEILAPRLGITSVLDHGCGRGSDVDYYRTAGLTADGWDPHPGFHATTEPDRQYDLVTNIFVLNVLPDPWQRIQALQHASRFVRPGGRLLVVTRSPGDIEPRAASAGWSAHHDGYWSSESKGTFQKGVTNDEILALGSRAGLQPAADEFLTTTPTAALALLVKPS